MKNVKLIISAFLLFTLSFVVRADDNKTKVYQGTVSNVFNSEVKEKSVHQELEVLLTTGNTVNIVNSTDNTARVIEYSKGDKVIVQEFKIGEGSSYVITDFYRTPYLLFLFVIFVIISVLVGRKHGLYSLIGMGFSLLVVFKMILPAIIDGKNPVFVTILSSFLIIPVTFYLSHGFNKKTHVAVVSTIIILTLISLFTLVSVNSAKLTGYSSDEAMFLQILNKNINMRGILLAGIIIGFLGVLDDVTTSQASVVMQLRESNRSMGTLELYRSAMKVGRDHISSMINTLVLVYTGSSLPILLLFINNPQPLGQLVSIELVADEIVRTLVGSIGLVLAVPLTTLLASIVADIE